MGKEAMSPSAAVLFHRRQAMLLLLFLLVTATTCVFGQVEEFQVHGPMDFHAKAMNTFLEMRRVNPKENMTMDSPFMQLANEHAERRMSKKPDAVFELRKPGNAGVNAENQIEGGGAILQLPSPDGEEGAKDSFLAAAVNSQNQASSGTELILPHEANAKAVKFNEEIGMGAISKTGALPMGGEGEWLDLAESKLKNDASLDYQALLWELGSASAEEAQNELGGLNITLENELLRNLEEWIVAGGGQLHFVKPNISSTGFSLLATENIHEADTVVSMPMKLIMCKQTARNVLITNKGKYLGDQLQKTFDKDELWGMTIFLLHEYYKEMAGKGSKWGPFIRTLRMRFLSTPVLQSLQGTTAAHLSNKWLKGSDKFMWWSVGSDGPCSPTTGICKTKPLEKAGESRFNIHQIRWAYWVVKQNAVKVKQMATGLQFIALIPYYNMMGKKLNGGGGITFGLDGTVSIHAGGVTEEGGAVSLHPGDYADSEFFLRYLSVPEEMNANNEIRLKLPGAIPKGSKFHFCMKGSSKERNKDECKASFKSESMFWKSKVLGEWRQTMGLPPRLQELRMWATRLHLYGGKEEMDLLSNANQAIAGLPLPVDQMPAEEQLMLLGIARDVNEAAELTAPKRKEGGAGGHGVTDVMLSSNTNSDGLPAERPPPQLYSAPDPEEDPEARRGMENLAMLALQAQNTLSAGADVLNVTKFVLNQTRDFFMHGVLPQAGLDELDLFLLKKIGMLAHCGFENDMKITTGNVTDELMCAMRVHLMNESEIHVFCPKDARVWEENCMNVEFMNFTAISENNERNVVTALRSSIFSLLASYPTTRQEDQEIIDDYLKGKSTEGIDDDSALGAIAYSAVQLRAREKDILLSALDFLDGHEKAIENGTVPFQLELKAEERVAADLAAEEHKKYVAEIQRRSLITPELAFLEVDMGADHPKVNLTLQEGQDLKQTVLQFCQKYGVKAVHVEVLEKALRARLTNPVPLQLMLGVITPSGHRQILAIPENANVTMETNVFCTRNGGPATPGVDMLSTSWCEALHKRVHNKLDTSFPRRVLLVVPIDSPDGRKLQLVVHEGEQHDLVQLVSDFFELYHMPRESIQFMANEVYKRLPATALQIPVGLSNQRQVAIRFSLNENITSVIAGFANFYELEDAMILAITKRALFGMAPGTFMV